MGRETNAQTVRPCTQALRRWCKLSLLEMYCLINCRLGRGVKDVPKWLPVKQT